MPVRSREIACCPDCASTDVGCIFRSLTSPVQCQDCGLEISREDWDGIFERAESRQRTIVAVGIPVAASAVAAPPRRNGFETVTHMGERVVFVPNLGLSVTRVQDADFWDAMDYYKSTLEPLKNKFAMELVTLSCILIAGCNLLTNYKLKKIPFSAIGESWKWDIKDRNDFWEEIPVHLVAELQESALKLAEKRGFCPDLVDFSK